MSLVRHNTVAIHSRRPGVLGGQHGRLQTWPSDVGQTTW